VYLDPNVLIRKEFQIMEISKTCKYKIRRRKLLKLRIFRSGYTIYGVVVTGVYGVSRLCPAHPSVSTFGIFWSRFLNLCFSSRVSFLFLKKVYLIITFFSLIGE